MNISDFKHSYQVRARQYEVDSQGIVHNAVYLEYFETGRIEYRRQFGYVLQPNGIFTDGLKVVVVNNTINYHVPIILDDVVNIYTRIAWIKNSSFCFHQLIENDKNKEVNCTGSGILVNLNPSNNTPEKLNEKFINEIKSFEKNIEILKR
ncbi:MAG TPA: thioesterase family protein [Ignavibacteria bacterium]|nr:thioesterase family protein [Ignavibacteria bacterium]